MQPRNCVQRFFSLPSSPALLAEGAIALPRRTCDVHLCIVHLLLFSQEAC